MFFFNCSGIEPNVIPDEKLLCIARGLFSHAWCWCTAYAEPTAWNYV